MLGSKRGCVGVRVSRGVNMSLNMESVQWRQRAWSRIPTYCFAGREHVEDTGHILCSRVMMHNFGQKSVLLERYDVTVNLTFDILDIKCSLGQCCTLSDMRVKRVCHKKRASSRVMGR